MKFSIREAKTDDYKAIIKFAVDLAILEGYDPGVVKNNSEKMIAENDLFFCNVAVDENNIIIGVVIYFYVYYTWVGKSLYIDDLFVQEEFRGKGIGKSLLDTVFVFAKDNRCSRLRWQVARSNPNAVEYYHKIGADVDESWMNCDFNEKAIIDRAASL